MNLKLTQQLIMGLHFFRKVEEGNSGLEGDQLPTSPITRTLLSDSTADNKEEKLHSEPNDLHIPYNAEQDGKILKQKIGMMSLKTRLKIRHNAEEKQILDTDLRL